MSAQVGLTPIRERRMAAYLAEHGQAPPCTCGCGTPVNFDKNGLPYGWKLGHGPRYDLSTWRSEFYGGAIPIEDFRAAVQKMKTKKGWTWDELADRAGISHSHIRVLIHGRSQKTVTRDWARDFFARLAGLPAPPSSHQLGEMERLRRLEKELEWEEWNLAEGIDDL